MAAVHAIPPLNTNVGGRKKATALRTDGAEEGSSANQVAHTLTACTRCRQVNQREREHAYIDVYKSGVDF